tara:strand:+ start:739 stop:1386 length:648 start_codon:yes stop_codon:yes gene_type:complete
MSCNKDDVELKMVRDNFITLDSLKRLDYRQYSTYVEKLDLRISPSKFRKILSNHIANGVLEQTKNFTRNALNKDSLAIGFRLQLDNNTKPFFRIKYEHLLDRVYVVKYITDYVPRNENEYNNIRSSLINTLRNKSPQLIEGSHMPVGIPNPIFAGKYWNKGNIRVSLNMYDWGIYNSSSNKENSIFSISITYSDIHYMDQLESYVSDYVAEMYDY